MRVFRFLVLATATAAGALVAPARAEAHALFADVKVTGDSVRLDAYFEEDIPAEFADVTVTDADGNVVQTGKTDERGVWTFPRPKPGTYTLTVRLAGHVANSPFAVDSPNAAPAETVFGGRRLNKWVGLGIGVVGLLGVSGASWLRRRRGRKVE